MNTLVNIVKFLISFFAPILIAYKAGRDKESQKQQEEVIKAYEKDKKINDTVDDMSDSDLDEWMRK